MKFMNVIKKFGSKEEMLSYRNQMLDEAEELLGAEKMEEYNAKMEDVKTFDAEYDQYKENMANIEALRGAAKVMTPAAKEGVLTAAGVIGNQEDMEYRKAFMNFVLKGTQIPADFRNGDAYTTTSDVGAAIPNTIINKIIEKLENIGGVYAKLTKTFYKGGVSVPTSAAKPVATWTTERGGSDKQKKALGSITFTYHKLRCVVAVSIAVDTVTLEVFESTLAKNIADAMVKAIEDAAFNGAGAASNQPEGILTKEVPEGQTIDITEGSDPSYQDLCKAEGALQDAYEVGTEWYMKKATFYNKFVAMTDENGQPIARVNIGVSGRPEPSLLGRKVNFVDYVPAFAKTVEKDTPFACMFNFADYILNTNLQVTIKEYEDHETDDQIKKAIMLVDGKPVDLGSLVVMQVKKA